MTERSIPLENKGEGHKGMDGDLIDPNTLLQQKGLDTPSYDLRTNGGLLTRAKVTRAYARPPEFRGNENGITKEDVKGVYLDDKPEHMLDFEHVDSGLEAEYWGFDRKGEFVFMMNPNNPFLRVLKKHNNLAKSKGEDPIDFTKEMSANCVELTFPHGKDISLRNRKYLDKLKALVEVAETVDVHLTPIANMPHRRLEPREITDHKYTHKLTFDVQGWDAAQHFDVTSMQPHVEIINHKAARKTINYLQFVTPILFGATLSGPFMDGQIEPDLKGRYETAPDVIEDEWKKATLGYLEEGEHQSYRPYGRFFGSPSGGILRKPIPVDEDEFLESIGSKLENGEVPTAGREGGHHTDRYRPDIPPYGTLEICTLDPAGGRTERVIAMREVTRALGWKMQMHFINEDFQEIQDRYPALFGATPSEESFEVAHWNTMSVAKDGANAILQGMNGGEFSTKELWGQLKKFIQEPLVDDAKNINYQGLPPALIDEVDKAYMDPSKLFDRYRDVNGVTSTKGFYETGIGNISQWMIQGARDRIAAGMGEKAAIMAVTVDVGESFHEHVKSTTPEGIQEYYKMPSFSALLQADDIVDFTRAN